MSTYATDTIRTLDFLLRKHDRLLRDAAAAPASRIRPDTRDKPASTPMTITEHDSLFVICQTTTLSSTQIARRTGRSSTIVSIVRRRRHRLYEAKRCEALLSPKN